MMIISGIDSACQSHHKGKYEKVSYQAVCECCGNEFTAHNKRAMYCSRKCRDVATKRKKGQDSKLEPRKIKCVICGKEFETFNATKKTCSSECSKELERNRKHQQDLKRKWGEHTAEEYKQIRKQQAQQRTEISAIEKAWHRALHTVERECEECGALFYCLDSENRVTCSAECSRLYKNHKADRRVPDNQRVDKIALKKLYKRDKGICYLCGGKCDWNDWRLSKKGNPYPGNKYPTIEHVIPISRGGLDAWDNVRLACWKCNTQKSNNIIKVQPMSKEIAYSMKRVGNPPKKTYQYSLDGKLIREWESTGQIARELGLNSKRIQEVCRGQGRTAFGFRWQYA